MSIYLGFDPGGDGRFGWAVVQESAPGALPLAVLATDCASSAKTALQSALDEVPPDESILAVGIDAPLVWSRGEGREVDNLLRRQIREKGCTAAGGTVQHVNSLRGGCVAQGMMTALLLREMDAGLPLSESHPKAWLWLAGVATREKTADCTTDITGFDLGAWLVFQKEVESEDERDAAIASSPW